MLFNSIISEFVSGRPRFLLFLGITENDHSNYDVQRGFDRRGEDHASIELRIEPKEGETSHSTS